jgi:uncharacterized protein with LGFP repeats
MKRLGRLRPPVLTAVLACAAIVAGVLVLRTGAAQSQSALPTVTVPPAHAATLPPAAPVKPQAEKISLATAKQPAGEGADVREAVPQNQFSLVGLTWKGQKPDSIQIRTLSPQGAWSPWQTVGEEDAAPDKPHAAKSSEAMWTGPSVRVQTRATRAGKVVTNELSAVTIDPGKSTNDTRIRLKASTTGVPTMPTVVTRAQWGADESLMTWAPQYASTVKAATVHHTANANNYTCDQSAALVRGIYYYHAVTNGWGDIGYNALVDSCGNIFEGRTGGLNLPTIGAHAGGFNTYTFGIAMIGDYSTVTPSSQTTESVSQMIAWKLANSYDDPAGNVTLTSAGYGAKYPAGTAVTLPTIFAHRDVWNTDCPGNAGYAALDGIRSRVVQLAGNWQSSPVYQKWQALGGANALGPVFSVESDWPGGGRAADFGSGSSTIAWRSDLGAHLVMGSIHDTFVRVGGQNTLGYPITDETGTPDGIGRYNHFSNGGSIYWTNNTGAHAVYGNIRNTWANTGWENGPLGYPITDETGTPDGIGRYNHFSKGGSIYWTNNTGAHAVYGNIRNTWANTGWEGGPLGYPTTDETGTPDGIGRYNHFSKGGSIYWTNNTGAHAVYGAIRGLWSSMGWEGSWLGFPTSDEYGVPEGRRNDFQGGYIVWNASTGTTNAYRY